MNAYEALARAVDAIHLAVIVYWVGGFFVPASRHPKFRKVHSWFGVAMFVVQVACRLRCPLTLLSCYLRTLARPGVGFLYEPFVVGLLKRAFGVEAPDITVTAAVAIGTVSMVITLINIGKREASKR